MDFKDYGVFSNTQNKIVSHVKEEHKVISYNSRLLSRYIYHFSPSSHAANVQLTAYLPKKSVYRKTIKFQLKNVKKKMKIHIQYIFLIPFHVETTELR